MSYNKDFVLAALPLIHFNGMTVHQEKEAGMPGGTVDPRKAMDPLIRMIDVRIAWERCTWLTYSQRQALLAVSMLGTPRLASQFLYWDKDGKQVAREEGELRRECDQAAQLLTAWLNSTYLDRMEWEEELDWDPTQSPAA